MGPELWQKLGILREFYAFPGGIYSKWVLKEVILLRVTSINTRNLLTMVVDTRLASGTNNALFREILGLIFRPKNQLFAQKAIAPQICQI